MIQIGQRYLHKDGYSGYFETYLLAQVDAFKIALIDLQSGNRWSNPVVVKNPEGITEKELDRIMNYDENFVLIS